MAEQTTSQRLESLETLVKATFARHEALALIKLKATEEPRHDATPGELMQLMVKRAAMARPVEAAREWAGAFQRDMASALSKLDSMRAEGDALAGLAKYLRGEGQMPRGLSPELRSAADIVAQSTDKSLALSTARRIELAIADQLYEVGRMSKSWADKTRSAVDIVVHKRCSAFLLECGENDAAAEHSKLLLKAVERNREIHARRKKERDDA